MSVELEAVRIITLKQRVKTLDLEYWERDVLQADMDYLQHARHHCNHAGDCSCFARLTPERIAAVAMKAHVPRDMVFDTLRRIDAKSELRVYYDMPPFAPDIQKRIRGGKRHNFPASGQRSKRGRKGYHQDFKRMARQLAGQGKSNMQIASTLHVDEKTVRNWLKHNDSIDAA